MFKLFLLLPFLLSCTVVRITPKACGSCNQKGGVVIVNYKGVDYIYDCSELLPDHKPMVVQEFTKDYNKYTESLGCTLVGSNPPWKKNQ